MRLIHSTRIHFGAAKVGSPSDTRVALEGHRFTISKVLSTNKGLPCDIDWHECRNINRESPTGAMNNQVKTLANRGDLNGNKCPHKSRPNATHANNHEVLSGWHVRVSIIILSLFTSFGHLHV